MRYFKISPATILNILILGIISYFFQRCTGLGDYTEDLGDGYYYYQDGQKKSIETRSRACNSEIFPSILDYSFDNQFIIAKQNPDYNTYKQYYSQYIYSDYYSYNKVQNDSLSPIERKRHIIDRYRFFSSDSLFYRLLKSKGVTTNFDVTDRPKIELVLDSVFKKNPYFIKLFSSKENYWIIDKIDTVRYGPYTRKEFDNKILELGIKLRLQTKSG